MAPPSSSSLLPILNQREVKSPAHQWPLRDHLSSGFLRDRRRLQVRRQQHHRASLSPVFGFSGNRPSIASICALQTQRIPFSSQHFRFIEFLKGRMDLCYFTAADLLQVVQIKEREVVDKKESSLEIWKQITKPCESRITQ
ncbi:hypothetical protein LXL04_018091 [Taraxacum kok-saghyz]